MLPNIQFRIRNLLRLDFVCVRNRVWIALVMCIGVTTVRADTLSVHQDLVVHVSGFSHEHGQAVARLFREKDNIFGKPYVRVVANIKQGNAKLIFPNVPYGEYAVTVFHDENANSELDHNFLSLPAEPLGFSNDFSLSPVSGMPSFEKLRFAFKADAAPLKIEVN